MTNIPETQQATTWGKRVKWRWHRCSTNGAMSNETSTVVDLVDRFLCSDAWNKSRKCTYRRTGDAVAGTAVICRCLLVRVSVPPPKMWERTWLFYSEVSSACVWFRLMQCGCLWWKEYFSFQQLQRRHWTAGCLLDQNRSSFSSCWKLLRVQISVTITTAGWT